MGSACYHRDTAGSIQRVPRKPPNAQSAQEHAVAGHVSTHGYSIMRQAFAEVLLPQHCHCMRSLPRCFCIWHEYNPLRPQILHHVLNTCTP